jgi:hypothetical protein
LQLERPVKARFGPAGRFGQAACVVLLWLFAQAVALSPELHHWLHGPAPGPGHLCAAVLLQNGLVEPAPDAPVILRPTAPPTAPVEPEVFLSAFPAHAFPPGRAPPAV